MVDLRRRSLEYKYYRMSMEIKVWRVVDTPNVFKFQRTEIKY